MSSFEIIIISLALLCVTISISLGIELIRVMDRYKQAYSAWQHWYNEWEIEFHQAAAYEDLIQKHMPWLLKERNSKGQFVKRGAG